MCCNEQRWARVLLKKEAVDFRAELSDNNKRMLWIPEGCAYGFPEQECSMRWNARIGD